MNKRSYEALYLRIKSKAVEHQAILFELFENANLAPGHTQVLDELEYHLLKMSEFEGALILLQERFLNELLEAQKEPSETKNWEHLLEKVSAIAEQVKPPAVALSSEELSTRSVSFRESAGTPPPITVAPKKRRSRKKKSEDSDE